MQLITLHSEHLKEAYPLAFSANEGLSMNSMFSLHVLSAQPSVDLDELLGQAVSVRITLADGGTRNFHAYAVSGVDDGQRFDKYVYKLELSTWLWFLKHNQDSRIFQNLSVPEIIQQVFGHYTLARYTLELEGDYPKREYCAQFQETDFNFVNRLLEDEGLYYRFEHRADEHTLVISDKQVFDPLQAPYSQLTFLPDGEEKRTLREGIQRLQRTRRITPSDIALRDYDYLKPSYLLQAQAQKKTKHVTDMPLTWYDYGAGYNNNARGEFLARLRLQAWQADAQVLTGESNAMGLVPGFSFGLALHPDEQRNRRFKLLRTEYTFTQDGPDNNGLGHTASCTFMALNDDTPYHPLRLTPKPQVAGIHSALVVGPEGTEVHTDSLGRIRVHFHWDRYTQKEADASCWMRVVQAWAGKGWGMLAMPRVGQEVLITYVDGDLDRPLVTGIVYNGENLPPYKLPEQIHHSGFVSRSLNQGLPQNASQLTFDDQSGKERLVLHAERDIQQTAERNASSTVGQDLSLNIARTLKTQATNAITHKESDYSSIGTKMSAIQTNFSFIGINTTHTGMLTSVIGTQTTHVGSLYTFQGMNNTFQGINVVFQGISQSFVGMQSVVRGLANTVTGISTNINGILVTRNGSQTTTSGSTITISGSAHVTNGSEHKIVGVLNNHVGLQHLTIGSSFVTVEFDCRQVTKRCTTTGVHTHSAGLSVSN